MPTKYEVLKERKKSDPEFAEKQKQYARKYLEANREKVKERQRVGAAKRRELKRDEYNAYMREWNAKHKDEINAKERNKLATDVEYGNKVRLRDRERHKKNPLLKRDSHIKTLYGITLKDYDLMYDKQQGKCAICGCEKQRGGQNGLVIDHCHVGGQVRELLCASCNHGLGKFKDNIANVQNALLYLMKHKQGE